MAAAALAAAPVPPDEVRPYGDTAIRPYPTFDDAHAATLALEEALEEGEMAGPFPVAPLPCPVLAASQRGQLFRFPRRHAFAAAAAAGAELAKPSRLEAALAELEGDLEAFEDLAEHVRHLTDRLGGAAEPEALAAIPGSEGGHIGRLEHARARLSRQLDRLGGQLLRLDALL